MRIDIPDGDGTAGARMWSLRPALGAAASAFGDAVQDGARLPVREMEAARMRIAHINRCLPCSGARIEGGDALGLDDAFYADVDDPARRDRYTWREALAIGFAERFAAGEAAFDDAFWAELRGAFESGELLELAACCAKWLGLGRLNAVLGVEVACPITISRPAPVAA